MIDDRWDVLEALFAFLEGEKLPYCVVGDTRGYPEEIASDIDIVVASEAFDVIACTVARFCRKHDLALVQMLRHEQTAIYFVLAWYAHNGQFRFLALDFCSDYFRGGRRLLDADEILARREPALDEAGSSAGYFVPPADIRFIYYLLKKIDKGELSDTHADYLSAEWHRDSSGALQQVGRFWPAPGDGDLIAHAAAKGDWHAVRSALPRLRRALRRAVPRSPAGIVRDWRRRLMRVSKPTGLMVAFLGPDGSGKSSAIERLMANLGPAFRRTRCLHLRPRVLGAGKAQALPTVRPHALAPRGFLASTAKLGWLLLDYLAGYVLQVGPLKCRSTLVVFDRYFHDLLVDPKRYRYGGSLALARWAARLVPQPDIWVVLDAERAVLQARKPEVSAEECERQRAAYLDFIRSRREGFVVDATQNLEDVAADATAGVLEFLARRLEARHPQLQIGENPLRSRVLLFFCRRRVPVLSKFIRIIFNSDIYCRIRSPMLMPHPYGIVIHSQALVGRGVTVMQFVTIGGKNPGGENAAPVIEDDVYIGAGAKIIGNVRVGRGAIVGANAVVTRDVPPYSTVVGGNRITSSGQRCDAGAQHVTLAPNEEDPVAERLSA